MDEDLKRIAARIRSWRDEAGLTLQQLGDRSGVSASTIHKIENLQTVPTIAVLLKVAHGLNRRPSELLAEVDVGRQVAVMRRDDRQTLAVDSRGAIEHLIGTIPRNKLDVWRVRIEPGVGAGMEGFEPWQFHGEMVLLVEEGLVRADGERMIRPARGSTGYGRLDRLARVILPTLERYFIVVALLEAHDDGAWATNELETACVLTARRMARLSGIDAPEFFDATLFRRFIDVACAQGLLRCDDDGRLHHDGRLRPALRAARRVLDPTFYDGVRATRALPALMPEATTAP